MAGRENASLMDCPQCGNPMPVDAEPQNATAVCVVCGSSIRVETHTTVSWAAEDSQSIPIESAKHGTQQDHYGSRLERFEVIDQIGIGGFGTVLKARDPELDRLVAIKIPRIAHLAGHGNRMRFLDEARVVAQLRHHGIVAVYEAGDDNGMPFLVTEYVEGKTLAQQIAERRPTVHEAAELCVKVAAALQHAHEAGIIHCDVKPGNVMLDRQDEPRLMDFGLAKEDTADITVSLDGRVVGTPAYMSPEQAAGESQAADCRTDVYSLGVLLYELLTGERPFRGNNQMVLYQVLHEEPRPPRTLNDRIPRDLESICLKAMNKEPGHRYPTAQALKEDLERLLRSEPVEARPAEPWTRLWLWCRRPARIREASTITVAMSLMLVFWELQGMFFLGIGVLEVEKPAMVVLTICGGATFFSILAAFGWLAKSQIVTALWMGLVAWILLMLFAVGCLAGLIQIEELSTEAVRIPVFGFFSVAAAIVLVTHLVSLFAYYSNRRTMRWARRTQLGHAVTDESG